MTSMSRRLVGDDMQLTGIIEKADVDVKIDVQRGRWSPAKEAEKEKEARTKEKVLLTSGCFEMAAISSSRCSAGCCVATSAKRERIY